MRGLALSVGGVGHGAGARFGWDGVGEGEALAEGVGDAGGRGGRGCLVGRGGVGGGRDKEERLRLLLVDCGRWRGERVYHFVADG